MPTPKSKLRFRVMAVFRLPRIWRACGGHLQAIFYCLEGSGWRGGSSVPPYLGLSALM